MIGFSGNDFVRTESLGEKRLDLVSILEDEDGHRRRELAAYTFNSVLVVAGAAVFGAGCLAAMAFLSPAHASKPLGPAPMLGGISSGIPTRPIGLQQDSLRDVLSADASAALLGVPRPAPSQVAPRADSFPRPALSIQPAQPSAIRPQPANSAPAEGNGTLPTLTRDKLGGKNNQFKLLTHWMPAPFHIDGPKLAFRKPPVSPAAVEPAAPSPTSITKQPFQLPAHSDAALPNPQNIDDSGMISNRPSQVRLLGAGAPDVLAKRIVAIPHPSGILDTKTDPTIVMPISAKDRGGADNGYLILFCAFLALSALAIPIGAWTLSRIRKDALR